jgi:protoheme IX farnesyltransferase
VGDRTPPGPWLRLTAVSAVAAAALVVASGALGLRLAHPTLALIALPPIVALATAAYAVHPHLRSWWTAALALMLAEAGSGAIVALTGGGAAGAVHLALAVAALAATAAAAGATMRTAPGAAAPWRDYVTLTKPRIMSLLLLTGACGMVVGAGGAPPLGRFAAAMAGLALACGGASALNHLIDRDLDRAMSRTERRPVAAGRVAPSRALEYGLALSAGSFVLLSAAVNPLTAVLALAGNLFYVVVYTRVLKRSTPQNIVIGGAAGAVPPLVGWAAATGNLTVPALALFAIVFVWTPPHFWALAILIKRDYQAAGVPMLPVVRGDPATARRILAYTLVLVPVTLVPAAAGTLGPAYAVSALALGGCFAALAWRLVRETTPRRAGVLFHYSLAYLALLYCAMAADALL